MACVCDPCEHRQTTIELKALLEALITEHRMHNDHGQITHTRVLQLLQNWNQKESQKQP